MPAPVSTACAATHAHRRELRATTRGRRAGRTRARDRRGAAACRARIRRTIATDGVGHGHPDEEAARRSRPRRDAATRRGTASRARCRAGSCPASPRYTRAGGAFHTRKPASAPASASASVALEPDSTTKKPSAPSATTPAASPSRPSSRFTAFTSTSTTTTPSSDVAGVVRRRRPTRPRRRSRPRTTSRSTGGRSVASSATPSAHASASGTSSDGRARRDRARRARRAPRARRGTAPAGRAPSAARAGRRGRAGVASAGRERRRDDRDHERRRSGPYEQLLRHAAVHLVDAAGAEAAAFVGAHRGDVADRGDHARRCRAASPQLVDRRAARAGCRSRAARSRRRPRSRALSAPRRRRSPPRSP